MNDIKRRFTVYGTCQAAALAAHLLGNASFADQYEYVPLSPCFSIPEEEILAWISENEGKLDLLITLNLAPGWRNGNESWDVENVMRSLNDRGRVLRYNQIYYRAENPLFVYPKTFARFPHCDYMDLISLTLHTHGFGHANLCERIYHQRELFSSGEIEAIRGLGDLEIIRRESNCDIKISDSISKLSRRQPSFFTFNHPKSSMLEEVARLMMRKLDVPLQEVPNSKEDILSTVKFPVPRSIRNNYFENDTDKATVTDQSSDPDDLVSIEKIVGISLSEYFKMSLEELSKKSHRELDNELSEQKLDPISSIVISAIERQLSNLHALSSLTIKSLGGLQKSVINPYHVLTKTDPQSTGFMVDLIGEIRDTLLPQHIGEHFSVLDLGAKTAAGSQLLGYLGQPYSYSKLKFSVTCADIDPTYVEYSRTKHPHVEYIKSDVFDLNRKWDIVVCSHVIEHVPNPLPFIDGLRSIASRYIFLAFPYAENPADLIPGHVNSLNHEFLRKLKPMRYKIYEGMYWSQSLCCIAVIKI